MKRWISVLLSLCLLLGALGLPAGVALAEEDEEFEESEEVGESMSDEDLAEIEQLDQVDESIYNITGKVWQEKTREDFDVNSRALYRGKLSSQYSIYEGKDISTKKLFKSTGDVIVDILFVGLTWMIVRYDKYIGYVKREWIAKSTIETLDPVNTPPFNAQKHAWLATTSTTCYVRKTMDPASGNGDDGNNWVILKPGTRISIWQFYEGWAMVNYMRSYGYIDPDQLTDLTPVSPTDEEMYPDCPIAAYTSYYNMAQTEKNINRIHNIKTGCNYISRVLQPGDEFNGNKVMGPYRRTTGYKPAGVLVDGGSTLGYGGGTCQVSSTLYNVIIQLPMIVINYRRPHGGNGASYLPIHCDAAVGNPSLNLIFTNGYDFPIRIDARSNDDGALCIAIYKAHE